MLIKILNNIKLILLLLLLLNLVDNFRNLNYSAKNFIKNIFFKLSFLFSILYNIIKIGNVFENKNIII